MKVLISGWDEDTAKNRHQKLYQVSAEVDAAQILPIQIGHGVKNLKPLSSVEKVASFQSFPKAAPG